MNKSRPSWYLPLLSMSLMTGPMALSQPVPVDPSGTTAGSAAESARPDSQFEAAYNMASLSVGGATLGPELQKVMREQLLEGFEQDPDFQAMELEFPGVTLAVVNAVLPVAVRQTDQNTPALIERLAKLYAAEMTADEIAVATEWFSSPAFSRISATMESNMDLSKIIRNSIADAESRVSSEDLDTIQNDSAAQSVSTMELADRAVLMRFSGTPAYAKLEALKSKSREIETIWTNENNPDHDAEMENIAIKALEEFTGLDLSE